jgi:hypothetical protein
MACTWHGPLGYGFHGASHELYNGHFDLRNGHVDLAEWFCR